ncbi:MAG: hypothetical protein D6820_12170, partial [Lentisphaerae bacterium]
MSQQYLTCLCGMIAFMGLMGWSDSYLRFNESGQPVHLILGGKEMLKRGASGGFLLRQSGGKRSGVMRLSRITVHGNRLTVSDPGGSVRFSFEIDNYPNHITIQLLDFKGIGDGRGYTLSLEFNSPNLGVYPLNDMVTSNFTGRKSYDMKKGRKKTEVLWPYLWGRPRPDGTHGSAVLYDDTLRGRARDDVMAEIWSVEGTARRMVRPAVRSWTKADVLKWVDRWVAKFSRIAKVSIAPKNHKELYEMTNKYVIPLGANRVYMFSTVWRGEYHLNKFSNTHVNTEVFPRGKADLIAYSRYLAKYGIHLQLKSLGPQIGKNDPRYFSPTKAETRIASWVKGVLVDDVSAKDTTMHFRPSGYIMKEMMKTQRVMRVGNELIEVKNIKVTGTGIWILTGCSRGFGATTAKPHQAGTDVAGYIQSNKVFDFADDFGQPNSLAEQVCGEYGDFLNEVKVGHLHFDGTGRMR